MNSKTNLINKLNDDLVNEYTHMHFYLQSSFLVQGINRAETSEWLAEHAESEFKHIQEFAKMIVGLGGVPVTAHKDIPSLFNPIEIFAYAYVLEREVVTNYVQRMEEVGIDYGLEDQDRKYVELFLEDQVLDSRGDLDEIAQFLKPTRMPS